MIVCVCHRVSDRHIACAVRGGCSSFEEVQRELRVGTGCGACRDYARQTFEEHAAAHATGVASIALHAIVAERRGCALADAVA
jgi:bacterioferritin-associated ferredoxin